MKKLFLILASVAALAGCGSCSSTKAGAESNKENMGTIHLTKASFAEKVADMNAAAGDWKYKGDKSAIIDFYADWCGPCRAIAPMLEELADEYAGQIYIYKINVDQEQELAAAFNVQSIPTLIFVPMNGAPHRVTGAMPKNNLEDTIKSVLLGK